VINFLNDFNLQTIICKQQRRKNNQIFLFYWVLVARKTFSICEGVCQRGISKRGLKLNYSGTQIMGTLHTFDIPPV